jgi:acyl-CoA hydrolase
MITDGMVDLVVQGVVTNERKTIHRGKIVGCFALGTRRLYDFLHENPMVEMYPVSYTNDPQVIPRNDNLVSINATTAVNLWGQCASESIGAVHYSGTGGQVDFARGDLASRGEKGF